MGHVRPALFGETGKKLGSNKAQDVPPDICRPDLLPLASIKQDTSVRDQLQQKVEVTDIPAQHSQAKLASLQEENAFIDRSEPIVFLVTLGARKDAAEDRRSPDDVGISFEQPVRPHDFYCLSDGFERFRSSGIGGFESADRMHQLGDGDGAMVREPDIDELVDNIRQLALDLVDVDAGIEQDSRSGCC